MKKGQNTQQIHGETQWAPPAKILNPIFLSIFFVNMVFNFGQSMLHALLSKYGDLLGFTAAQIGMLASAFAVTALVFRFVAGPAMDALPKKFLLMVAIGFMTIAYIGYAMSSTFPSLMAFRLLQGMGTAFGNACCLVIASDALPKEKFNAGIGYYTCAQVIAQAIAPSTGLQLVEWFGYRAAYLIGAVVTGVAILVTLLLRTPPRVPKAFRLNLRTVIAKEALLPAAIMFFVCFGFNVINSLLIVYAGKRGVGSEIGLFFTVYALCMLVTRPMVGKLIDRVGFFKIGIPAILLTAIALFTISVADRLWLFLLAAVINALGFGPLQPALQGLGLKSVPSDRRGSASCMIFVGLDASTLVAPTIAGALADSAGYPAMWRIMILPLLIGVLILTAGRRRLAEIETSF